MLATAVPLNHPPLRGARLVHALERALDRAFGASRNPLRQLGALGFHLFWIAAASGIYVYAFYETGVDGAWSSLQALERDQRWAGGLMRGVHRYSSDALVVVAALHLVREWLLGRHKGFRWFTWVSGVPLLWLVLACGIVGFWLAWDREAAWVAQASLEWLVALPALGDNLVRNVVIAESVSDRLFSLTIFIHIGLTLMLLLGMWIHVQRLATPATRPNRGAGMALLATLLLLAAVLPAPLGLPADIARLDGPLAIDWFYLAALPLSSAMPAATWLGAAAMTLILLMLPWLPPARRAPVAVVDPAHCNGCGRCFDDCPYGAVVMVARRDGRAHRVQAQVDADLCAGCGICTGSCPSATPFRTTDLLVSGIDSPQRPVQQLREEMAARLGALGSPGAAGAPGAPGADSRLLVFACERGADATALRGPATEVLTLTCIGQLPPAFVDFALRDRADGVLVSGCGDCDCEFRSGSTWARERLFGEREPHLRASVERRRFAFASAGPGAERQLATQVEALRASLQPATQRRPASPAVPNVSGAGHD